MVVADEVGCRSGSSVAWLIALMRCIYWKVAVLSCMIKQIDRNQSLLSQGGRYWA